MTYYPMLERLTPPESVPDFITFVDKAIPPSACALKLNPRRHDDQELARAFSDFRPELIANKALYTWLSYAGTASLVETEADNRILRINALDLGFFEHNFSPTTGELGAFEDFAREVEGFPTSEFTLQMRTPPDPDEHSLIKCVTRHTPETGLEDSREHEFSLAPDIAARALWLAGTFVPKRLLS